MKSILWAAVLLQLTVMTCQSFPYWLPCANRACICNREEKRIRCENFFRQVPNIPVEDLEGKEQLDLTNNQITHINEDDFNTIGTFDVNYVDLRGNPNLDCSTLRYIPKNITVASDCVPEQEEIGYLDEEANEDGSMPASDYERKSESVPTSEAELLRRPNMLMQIMANLQRVNQRKNVPNQVGITSGEQEGMGYQNDKADDPDYEDGSMPTSDYERESESVPTLENELLQRPSALLLSMADLQRASERNNAPNQVGITSGETRKLREERNQKRMRVTLNGSGGLDISEGETKTVRFKLRGWIEMVPN